MGIEIGFGDRAGRSRHGEREVLGFQLKGWMAIPALVLVVLFAGYRAMSARATFSGPQGELLKQHLQGEYATILVPKLKAAQTSGDSDLVSKLAKEAVETNQIEFTSVGVKGTGKEVIAKVDIRVAGGTPPDGKAVRYFVMSHRFDGWRVKYETGALRYYSKLF